MISSCDYELVYDYKKLEDLKNIHNPDVIVFTFKLNSLPVGSYKNSHAAETELENVKSIVEKKCIPDDPHLDPWLPEHFGIKKQVHFNISAKKFNY